MQKDFQAIVDELLPNAEHRRRATHLIQLASKIERLCLVEKHLGKIHKILARVQENLHQKGQARLHQEGQVSLHQQAQVNLHSQRRETARHKRTSVATGEEPLSGGHNKTTNVGFGIYTSTSETRILNLGTSSQRILASDLAYKDTTPTGINLSYKAKDLRWKDKECLTTSQLQLMAIKKKTKNSDS
ncbi:hypothetical protein K7X08_032377 [Anisodus acutangulus]|uniref:Uncharacterized protein n=1 Tax=Anisodus acutangulus TaxID=402998 RepID=A0A9Q1LZR6_9SOLA|nr:hypothetical protein K7X08_032377 [Anisodus acutangulus]